MASFRQGMSAGQLMATFTEMVGERVIQYWPSSYSTRGSRQRYERFKERLIAERFMCPICERLLAAGATCPLHPPMPGMNH